MTATAGFTLATPNPGSGGKFPHTAEKPILTGYAELEGAPLTIDGNGNWVACGADPAMIAAISLTQGGAYTTNPGFNILGRYEFPPLYMQAYILTPYLRFQVPFLGAYDGTVGLTYGITRDPADNAWKLDFNKTDKPTVVFLGNPTRSPADAAAAGQNQLVSCSFLDGVIQPL